MDVKKGSTYWLVFETVWRFFKSYIGQVKDDKFWTQAANESADIIDGYGSAPEKEFVRSLLTSCMREFQRKEASDNE